MYIYICIFSERTRAHTHIYIFIDVDIKETGYTQLRFLHFPADRSAKPISARECSPEMELNMVNFI